MGCLFIAGLTPSLPDVELGVVTVLSPVKRLGLTIGLAVATAFDLGMRLGARCGVDAGFFSGLGGWGSLGPSGYFDLLDPPIPNSLLKKPGFFTVAFSPRCAWVGLVHAITDREHIPQRD